MTERRIPARLAWTIVWLGSVLVFAGPGSERAVWGQEPKSPAGPGGGPTVESVLRKTADFYKQAKSFVVELDRSQKVGPLAMQMTTTVAFERPNRLAVHPKGSVPSIELVTDGKTMFLSIPALQKYTEGEAPATIDKLVRDPIAAAAIQFTMIGDLCAADPYASFMEGVKTTAYAGQETLDGTKTHHLKFAQDQFDWEMWVAADGDPIVRRVVVDLAKSVANSPAAAQFKDQKMEMIHNFKNWQFDRGVDEKSFTFQPPEGAEKVKSFLEAFGGGGQAAPSPLLNKPAPDVSLRLLDEGEFQLKAHRGARVVMLDFWATWCGPCVEELPLLVEVADGYKDKDVVFCAINQQEEPEKVRKFLTDKKLKMTVALDSEGKVGGAYHVEAIPTLVLIDKKGVVQSVHLGYDPAIKTTLRSELDALLAGKDLAKDALRAAKATQPKDEGVTQAWSVSGTYTGIATDAKGQAVYAVQGGVQCDLLDSEGKTIRTFRLPEKVFRTIRLARQSGGSVGVFAFAPWGNSVLACKSDGTKLWDETGGQGIDDVCAADLDGDGVDEAIVGYNGGTGLHVFAADGKRLWSRTDMGNVWHVSAGDLDADGKPEVVTTSAQGKVHVFAPGDGKPLRTLDASLYANMIRIAPGRSIPSSKGDIVLVIGSGSSGLAMVALSGDGKIQWTVKLPSGAQHCDSLAVSPDGTWAAVGLRGGQVCVVDIGHGRIVAQVSGQGTIPEVAWAARAEPPSPLLLVATGMGINAYRVNPVAAPTQDSQP
jgi:thiol-disulfide isomerase/thioredoxin